MLEKRDIIEIAHELGFADVGFTNAAPFESQTEFLCKAQKEYEWVLKSKMNFLSGVQPGKVIPWAKAIIILIESYAQKTIPDRLLKSFGRSYLSDNWTARERMKIRIGTLQERLKKYGVLSNVPFNIPQKLAAARAGLGTFGKNGLFYSNKATCQGSFVWPIPVIVDQEFSPDEPSVRIECPDNCENACLNACPTSALKGNGLLDTRRCISRLTCDGEDLTPRELRKSIGLWIDGCDVCQNVCPRNAACLSKDLPTDPVFSFLENDLSFSILLHMKESVFRNTIWPHRFVPAQDLWRWKMNVARAIGNSHREEFVPDLIKAFHDNGDERVLGMIAWALGQIDNSSARKFLESILPSCNGLIREEVILALRKDDK